ncbi:MAG: P27 family phage terminase small subunit [Desulfurellales bacterium]|nr:MAG: P27 family phage terminase small subunit [Desulfurellales bacterium]
MGTRGPAKTPTAILRLRGSELASHREGEPEPQHGLPVTPDGLPDEAVSVWERTCEVLSDMRVLTVADGAQLERYARMLVLWRKVQQVLDSFATAEDLAAAWDSDRKRPIIRNALAESRNLDTHLKQIEGNYGLTPAARARIACLLNGKEQEVKDSRESKFFGSAAS